MDSGFFINDSQSYNFFPNLSHESGKKLKITGSSEEQFFTLDLRSSLLTLGIADASIALLSLNRSLHFSLRATARLLLLQSHQDPKNSNNPVDKHNTLIYIGLVIINLLHTLTHGAVDCR